jgi:CRP/FNR family transcriptional regulator, cyclic AMP receptor protein
VAELPLDPRAQEELKRCGYPRLYPRGDLLFGEGERTDFAVLLCQGYVKIAVGSRDRIVGIRGPGEIVGELAAIEEQPRSASVYAMNDVEAYWVPGDKWRDFVKDEWEFTIGVLRLMANRLREATTRQAELGSLAIEQRIAKNLLDLEDKIGEQEPAGIAVYLTQAELASLTHTTRETVSRQVKAWGSKILLPGRQKFIIRDSDTLRRIAKGRGVE